MESESQLIPTPMTSTSPPPSHSQADVPPRTIYRIVAGQLFDPVARVLLQHQVITIDAGAGIILAVEPVGTALSVAQTLVTLAQKLDAPAMHPWVFAPVQVVELDMRDMTLLPGLVDAHVHRESPPAARARAADATSVPASVLRDAVGGAGDRREPRGAHGARDRARAAHAARWIYHRPVRACAAPRLGRLC